MFRVVCLTTALSLAAAVPAAAQQHVGIRAGVSGDPDQFFVGGHAESRPLVDQLTFRPNVEVGFGDRATRLGFNVEFAYWVPIPDSAWRFYLGGGPALNIYAFDDDHPGRGDDSDVGGGVNVLVGVQHAGGLFTEVKVGAVDSPSVRFAVGYAFR